MRKYLIGITGSIGTGKSTVCQKLSDLGYKIIDCDYLSHKILDTTAKKQVIEVFQDSILDNGSINRKKLGQIVFNDNLKKKQLEDILHPLIKSEVLRISKEIDDLISFVEIPLLYEANFQEICDFVIVVACDKAMQIERVVKRDNLTFELANLKINSQMDLKLKCKLADYVILNNDIGTLDLQIKDILKDLERKCL